MENNYQPKTNRFLHKNKNKFFLVWLFPFFSLFVLLGTTIYWSFLGAKIQQLNSDQVVGPYLFSNSAVFKNASFPGVHSFLLKWPLLRLIGLYNYSPNSFIYVTVVLCLLTVFLFSYILYRIEKRPLVIGAIFLAITSILLLVPSQPVPGALLPVNMAMITQRNIEYIIFILSILLLVKYRNVRNWQYWLSTFLLAILVASDKLFLGLAVGGALIGLIFYSFIRKWKFVGDFARWFGSAFLAGALGIVLLIVLNHIGFTGIANSSAINPYITNSSAKNLLVGLIYSVMATLTNMGANPAHSEVIVRNIPKSFVRGLYGESVFSFLVNFSLLILGLYAVFRVFIISTYKKRPHNNAGLLLDNYYLVSLFLIFSSIFMLIVYVFTSHYYAVDARYLTISFFAIIVALTVYLKHKPNIEKYTYFAIPILLISIGFGIFSAWHEYRIDLAASSINNSRDLSIVQALKNKPNILLVGNYWRVVPLKESYNKKLNIYPVSDCNLSPSEFYDNLWQKDLHKTSFAYLLTISGSVANSPNCTVTGSTELLGRPNSSVLIAGTYDRPKELLLIYDRGLISKKQRRIYKNPTSTVLTQNISQFVKQPCSTASSMNIVAHQDDDLLFMNPDIYKEIQKGYCERTVYVTAGDAGNGKYYWLSREEASEKAYSIMIGKPNIEWNLNTVKLNDYEYVQIANPVGNSKISLIFMLCPDGNLKGQGFSKDNSESLQKLYNGSINKIHTVDGQSFYSRNDLINALLLLMNTYRPDEIKTQETSNPVDHSDHKTVGLFTTAAYSSYNSSLFHGLVNIPFAYYEGYEIRTMKSNVSANDLKTKTDIFSAYITKDLATCNSLSNCLSLRNYGAYLDKEYSLKVY